MKWSRRHALGAMAGLAGAALPNQTQAAAPQLPLQLVVLDIGGTIVEERGDIPEALDAAFSKKGISLTRSEIDEWRGSSKREIVRHFVTERVKLPEGERDKLIEAIYADFQKRIIESYRTIKGIPGVEEALRAMRNVGLTLATSTGFDAAITASIMSRLGWGHYFVAQITSDDVAQGRPSPYMLFHAMEKARVDGVTQVVAVGDTPLDLRAAANGGIGGIVGVLSGAGKQDAMERESHTDIIDSVATLPALLRSKYNMR